MSNRIKPGQRLKTGHHSFPVVAIGASSGGLEAVTELLKNLPADTGMAYLYVQHLSPDHKSMLASILAQATAMKVAEAVNKEAMLPNNVYVIPPNKEINIVDGHIKLTLRPPKPKLNLPVDILFSSLAQTHGENVIGIILSGSATDGTRGIKSIKQAGGVTFAQDDSAKFPSMPKSAIAAGVVDFILSPKQIAQELSRLSKHPLVNGNKLKADKEEHIVDTSPHFKAIITRLQKVCGVDFNAYKLATVKRRIVRRMMLNKIKSLREYLQLLEEKKDETEILYRDLLINVTGFFRDGQAHQYLKNSLLPKLLRSKKGEGILRMWVPACSTGEEAYSLAMMLLEIQNGNPGRTQIQIFATDIDDLAITKARVGIYNEEDLIEVSPKRLQRFFTKTINGYRIAKVVRDMCVFARHNILTDPPFFKLDFISCRNLFIYFDAPAQKRTLGTFHYALNENGLLMLGKSESIGASLQLFNPFNKKFKIFLRKNNPTQNLPVLFQRVAKEVDPERNIDATRQNNIIKPISKISATKGLDEAIDKILITEFVPASVVINYEMEIQQFRGSTDIYLTHLPGRATLNILKMVRTEIAFDLRNAISQAIKSKNRVHKSGIEMVVNDIPRNISIALVPLKIEKHEPLLLILFTEQPPETFPSTVKGTKGIAVAKDRRIKKLEEELTVARADAMAFSQEQEAYHEELQSANEEIVSSNEELQSVNEELETSNEEIESTNEELTTTNQELQTRNDLLNESYEYSEAILATLHEPLIVLDKDLRIKSANNSFYKKFGFSEEEIRGVFLYDLDNKQWDIKALRRLLEDIIPKNFYFEDFEVNATFSRIGQRIMLLNARRVNLATHKDRLILLSISDISEKELYDTEVGRGKKEKAELENAVEQRTKELQRAVLELQEMNKELEAFSFITSHDLQEPLRKIETFVSLVLTKENKNVSDKGKEYLRLMQKSVKQMRTLIQDLLAFSRLGTQEREFERIDLKKIVKEVVEEFKDSIKEKHATVEFSELGIAKVNRFQFHQLLHNLFSNALKFSNPKVSPHITIKYRKIKDEKVKGVPHTQSKQYCHISFSDNGIGFEKKYSEKIFEVFQRLNKREEYIGTGIGLAIVKKVVMNHNGIITARGIPHKGATFDIYIPD